MAINYAVAIVETGKASLIQADPCGAPGVDEVIGENVYSLISPGTELNMAFLGNGPFPKLVGYAAVMKIIQVGSEVTTLKEGDYVLCMARHQKYNRIKALEAVILPVGIDKAHAAIARLINVSMTTLMTTAARPGDHVMIMGAGPVGYLAAHTFKLSGYQVTVCEPDSERRELIRQSGISSVFAEPKSAGVEFSLTVECSGHEAAVLQACQATRKGGEVVLVGVPWKQHTNHTAHEILHVVFHRYIHLRSGWEWELPRYSSDFQPHSIYGNFHKVIKWVHENKFPLDGRIKKVLPKNAQHVYDALNDRSYTELFVLFDWKDIGDAN